jgi:hypothetical protein
MAEIELNRETVQRLIDRTREFHTRDDVSFDEAPEIDDDDWSQQVASYTSDPYYQEIKTTIDDLEPDQQVTLVALMWIGRGDFSMDELGDALKEAEDNWNPNTADYLIGTPMLSDYLTEALGLLESEDSG